MIELVIVLLTALWLFMLIVAAVLHAFDFIAEAIPAANSMFHTNIKSERVDERAE